MKCLRMYKTNTLKVIYNTYMCVADNETYTICMTIVTIVFPRNLASPQRTPTLEMLPHISTNSSQYMPPSKSCSMVKCLQLYRYAHEHYNMYTSAHVGSSCIGTCACQFVQTPLLKVSHSRILDTLNGAFQCNLAAARFQGSTVILQHCIWIVT